MGFLKRYNGKTNVQSSLETPDFDFPITKFKGGKLVILSTVVWSGGSNPFLGIAYVVTGTAATLAGFVITAVHLKLRKKKTYFQRH